MSDKNLLLQENAFAPAAPDTLERFPSHHCAVAAPVVADDIKARLIDAADRSPVLRKLIYDACAHISSLEHRLAEASNGNAMYEHVRTLNPRDFQYLWNMNLNGYGPFDDLVTADMEKRKWERA